jgi:hypothetical protein
MRKLWPPYHDEFSFRLWAASGSVFMNLLVALLLFIPNAFWISFLVGLPGWFAFMIVGRQGIEEADFNLWAIVAGLLVNFGFYYAIARWVFSAFQPVSSWWPEKRT